MRDTVASRMPGRTGKGSHMDRGRTRRTATTIIVLAALATACRGGPRAAAITDEDTVLDAVAESFAGSWTWSGQLDVDLSEDQIGAVVDLGAGDEFGAGPDALAAQVRLALDEFDRQRMHGALGADQSFRTAWQRDDTDLVDVRLDWGQVLRADTMTPEAGIVGAVDVPAISQWWADMARVDGGMLGVGMVPSVEQLEQQARMHIPEPELLAVVLAILDGGFGGVVGQLDFADLGVTEDQLDEVREGFAEELIGLADADTFRQLAGEAVTIRDVATDGGVTRAVVDLHPRAAAEAVYDLFDDAQAIAEDLGDSYLSDEELPETIEAVAQLTFDADGHLTEVRTDVLGVAGQLADEMELGAEASQLLTAVQGATVHVVFGFGGHDAVETVVDVDATTMPWDGITDFFAPEVDEVLDR